MQSSRKEGKQRIALQGQRRMHRSNERAEAGSGGQKAPGIVGAGGAASCVRQEASGRSL